MEKLKPGVIRTKFARSKPSTRPPAPLVTSQQALEEVKRKNAELIQQSQALQRALRANSQSHEKGVQAASALTEVQSLKQDLAHLSQSMKRFNDSLGDSLRLSQSNSQTQSKYRAQNKSQTKSQREPARHRGLYDESFFALLDELSEQENCV